LMSPDNDRMAREGKPSPGTLQFEGEPRGAIAAEQDPSPARGSAR
jgi:hypothetical protein